tara:strand:+ start:3374 stop:4273 length:900 start_codon:yes stop_codon:yes gene_type:complete
MVTDITSTKVSAPYDAMRFQMVRCVDCGLNYQRVQLTPQDIGMFYDSEYFCYVPISERGLIVKLLTEFSAKTLLKKLRKFAPSDDSTLFDYGCGNGNWLSLLQSVGAPWKLAGSEIDADLVKQVQEAGFDAVVANDSNLLEKVAPGSVGIFFMNHVIEHVRSPLDLLHKIFEVLEPGGIVYGQTPDSNCLEARLFGDRWTQWHLPQHLVLFDKRTMRQHAEKAGFEVIELSSSPSAATQWAASLLWAWSAMVGREYRASREPLHAPLTLLFAPLSLIQSKVANTSHMDFVLRKPVAGAG